jgi:hypothetical protein
MKYIVDLDTFADCLECLHGMVINGKDYVSIEMVKAFIERFPKDPVIPQIGPNTESEQAE